MHRKAVVFAFLFAFSAMIAWSLGQSGGQTAVPQAGTSTAQPAQPAQPQAGNEAAKAEDKNAAAQTRSFTENSKPFVADRHIAGGLQCSSCHGEAEPKQAVATKQCLQCHESFEALAKRTADIEPNPHSNHQVDSGDAECNYCHHGHKANEIGCRSCHADRVFIRGSAAGAKKTQ